MREAIEYESKVAARWVDCFKPERKQLYRTLLGESSSSSFFFLRALFSFFPCPSFDGPLLCV